MKRPIAGESIARFVYDPEEIDPYIDALIAQRDRLQEALEDIANGNIYPRQTARDALKTLEAER